MSFRIKSLVKVLGLSCVALTGVYAGSAQAACGVTYTQTFTIGQGTPVIVRGNEAPDQIIKRAQADSNGPDWSVGCSAGTYQFVSEYNNPDYKDIYPVRLDTGEQTGLGLRIFARERAGAELVAFPVTSTIIFEKSDAISFPDTVQYELVRMTGPVQYGRARVSTAARSGVQGNYYRLVNVTNDLIIQRPSCSVSSDSLNQQVDLGTHAAGSLGRPGDGTPWRNFSLVSENCDDPSGQIAQVTFGANADSEADDPALFNLGTTAKRGVGIQIARDTPESEAMLPGATEEMPAVVSGAFYRFKARLKRTSSPIVAGNFSKAVVVQVDFR